MTDDEPDLAHNAEQGREKGGAKSAERGISGKIAPNAPQDGDPSESQAVGTAKDGQAAAQSRDRKQARAAEGARDD